MMHHLLAALVLVLGSSPAAAQSLTLTNLKGPVARACGTAEAKSIPDLWRQLKACAAPGKAPEPMAPSLAQATMPAWGTGQIPREYDPNEGAFRFICGGDGPLAYDDPIVYPGRPGAAHLHQVWGNKLFDADLTTDRLLASAPSNCNETPHSLNRSSYWQPALIHDSGEVVRPDLVSVYYKRKRAGSPYCAPGGAQPLGICVELPARLRFVMGWDQTRPTAPFEGASWYCTGAEGHHRDLDAIFAAGCKAGDDLIADTVGPNCWDGKNLDSPDHRSHMSHMVQSANGGRGGCPATHPYLIAQQQNKAQFKVTADMIGTRPDGTRFSRVSLSSDHMLPGAKPGATLHADYMEGWLAEGRKVWHDHCIDKGLDCSGGDLGNGRMLHGAREPVYGWVHPRPRAAMPPKPAGHAGH